MTKKLEIYKCGICGNIVEVLHSGAGELVCCGEPMEKQDEKTADHTVEKHVPVISRSGEELSVTVGSTLHPMEEKHCIEWIQIISGGSVFRQFLSPGQEPSAVFKTGEGKQSAREYCNVHGLWKSGPEVSA